MIGSFVEKFQSDGYTLLSISTSFCIVTDIIMYRLIAIAIIYYCYIIIIIILLLSVRLQTIVWTNQYLNTQKKTFR